MITSLKSFLRLLCAKIPICYHAATRTGQITTNLDERLRAHNAGGSPHTSKYRLWKLVLHLWFQDEQRAVELERYLKSGSGHAFANKHFCKPSCPPTSRG